MDQDGQTETLHSLVQALQQVDQLKGEVMNFAKHVRAA